MLYILESLLRFFKARSATVGYKFQDLVDVDVDVGICNDPFH